MNTWRQIVSSRWFKILLSSGLLALLLRTTDLAEMRAALHAAHAAWLVLGLAAFDASQLVGAYRWILLARPLGFTEPFGRICVYYFSAAYLNLFGPGTVAGDISRTLLLARGRRRALAFTTVIADRVIGLVTLIWIAAIALVLVPVQSIPASVRWLAALAVPVTIGGWIWGPRLIARLLPRTNNWRVLVERDLAPYWHDWRLLAQSMSWAAVVHALQIGTIMLIATALGQHLPWAFFLVVVPLVNIAGALPLSLQGVGVREAGFWYYLAQVGVSRETALAIGLLSSATVLAAGLTGLPAFLLLRQGRTSAASTERELSS